MWAARVCVGQSAYAVEELKDKHQNAALAASAAHRRTSSTCHTRLRACHSPSVSPLHTRPRRLTALHTAHVAELPHDCASAGNWADWPWFKGPGGRCAARTQHMFRHHGPGQQPQQLQC